MNNTYAMLESLPFGLLQLDGGGKLLWLNRVASDLLQHPALGSPWLMIIQQCFEPRDDDGHEVSLKNGRRLKVAISTTPDGIGQLICLIDLSSTREYESQRARQQRLASIGQMTAQLAHQIRTPLSSALLLTDLLSEQFGADSAGQRYICKIKDSHRSIARLVEDCLLYSRGDALKMQVMTIHDFTATLKQRVEALPEYARVSLQWSGMEINALISINCEALCGAVLNLVQNAIDANARHISISLQQSLDSWSIGISDDGDGMSEAEQQSVGTPFISSKAKGCGLGVAVVKAVALAHGGDLTIESTPAKGSTFTMLLQTTKG